MLLGLKRSDDRPAPDGIASRLLACHERIRRFSALGVKIADSPDAAADELAAAADAVNRYFTIALPLHVADEDESLRPRLLAGGAEDHVARALETVTREHFAIEGLIAELTPLWAAAAAKRAGPTELARDLVAAKDLESLLAEHLSLEEQTVFPALAHLETGRAALIVAEMKARRG